ncbi:MAG TPA: cupin domain-containing protein [Polyangia bacterium]
MKGPHTARATRTQLLAFAAIAGMVSFGATAQVRAAPPADPSRRAAEAIEKALQRHAPDVHRCFEKALADRLDVAGDLEVEVDIGRGGNVVAAKLVPKPGAAAPPELSTCVEQAARGFVLSGIEEGASVVWPFAFQGQSDQFAVKVADVPARGPRVVGKRDAPPPFSVKVLLDPVNTRAPKASLTLLTVAPKNRVAMHRHPRSAKALYLVSGRGRVLGPPGAPPLPLEPGAAVYIPPGYPHVIETVGQKEPAIFLQAFSPPGPEQVYRDPNNAEARADFEVIRKPPVAPAGAAATLMGPGTRQPTPWPDAGRPAGGSTSRLLIDGAKTAELSLATVDMAAGSEVTRHSHDASELVFVLSGGGTLQVGSESTPFGPDTALYLPAGQPHALKAGAATRLVQIFAPGGSGPSPGAGASSDPAKAASR